MNIHRRTDGRAQKVQGRQRIRANHVLHTNNGLLVGHGLLVRLVRPGLLIRLIGPGAGQLLIRLHGLLTQQLSNYTDKQVTTRIGPDQRPAF